MLIDKNKDKITKQDISRSKQYIYRVIKYIRQYSKTHVDLDKTQLMQNIDDTFVDSANVYLKTIQRLSGIYVQLFVIDYLLNNENVLKNEYQKYRNKPIQEDDNSYYNYDIKKSSRLLIKETLVAMKKKVQHSNIELTYNEEYQYLKQTLNIIKTNLLSALKEDNINILIFAKDFLDDYNILETLTKQDRSQLESLWLEALSYNMNPNDEYQTDIGVNALLSEENLKHMSAEELAVLNMFWQNKLAKKLADIGFGYFAFQQLELYDNLSESHLKIDDETIKNILLKYNVLERVSSKITDTKDSSIIDNLADEYQEYFSRLFPDISNDLHQDLDQCINRITVQKNTYRIKDNLICGTIINLMNNKKIKNWGYINENDDDRPNSIKTRNKFILIGIDYPGFNRPVSVHMEKEILQNVVTKSLQPSAIPIYEGDSDFSINFEHLKTHIVLPLEKRHKEFLRTVNKNR